MTTRLRIEEILLMTEEGPVIHKFTGPLTVMTGPVGVGKSTIFEFMKFATGGNARLAPPVVDEVSEITMTALFGDRRLALTRALASADRVWVRDLVEGSDLGAMPVNRKRDSQDVTIGEFLLQALGLPSNADAASKTRLSRITFNAVWSFVYVEQREIDRSIAHHADSVREPMRRATFELLYGFTNSRVLDLKAELVRAEQSAIDAQREETVVREFLAVSKTRSRLSAQQFYDDQVDVRLQARARMDALQVESSAVRGQVGILREMLLSARDELVNYQEARRDLENVQAGRVQLLQSLADRSEHVERGQSAADLLGGINFLVCPRCSQSLRNRAVDDGACMLCLQPEPSDDPLLQRRASYELERIARQREELAALIENGHETAASIEANLVLARANLANLEALLDERTESFVSPRLEMFVDAAAELASAEARIQELEHVLRQWDRVHDLERLTIDARSQVGQLQAAIREGEDTLRQFRANMLDSLSANYRLMVSALGVPAIVEAHIDSRTYLPYANEQRFDQLSSGGITTSLVTAYWLAVLATALREGNTLYPSLLIIDTPRKSIGSANAQLADELYRQLDILSEIYKDRMQVIIADNDVPRGISKEWQEMRFDYDNPTVPTIEHPGIDGVVTLEDFE